MNLEIDAARREFARCIRYRFDAALERIEPAQGIMTEVPARTTLEGGVELRQTIHFPALPGVATFFVSGNRLHLAGGLQTAWTTGGAKAR